VPAAPDQTRLDRPHHRPQHRPHRFGLSLKQGVQRELKDVEQDGEAMRDDSKAFKRNPYDPKEAEANRFAAEILMLADRVRFMIERSPTRPTLKSMARRFGVSELAMECRLKNIGWI
jgi:hypothetical protein